MDDVEPENLKDVKRAPGKPFKKGETGNRDGKKAGTRNAVTLMAEALLDGESEALVRKLIEMALAGNIVALRLAIERILPPRRERTFQFDMPSLTTAEDAVSAIARIAEGVGRGELSESEARTLNSLVHTFLEARAHVDFELRVTKLEQIKSDIEEKALDVREQNAAPIPLGFFKTKAPE